MSLKFNSGLARAICRRRWQTLSNSERRAARLAAGVRSASARRPASAAADACQVRSVRQAADVGQQRLGSPQHHVERIAVRIQDQRFAAERLLGHALECTAMHKVV